MITVTKQMRTETGHRLMDYDGKCSHLHGHSYLWEVTATAPELTDNGMIVDFKDLKAAMMKVIDPFDHASVFRCDDLLGRLVDEGRATNDAKQRVFIIDENPTAEWFVGYAAKQLQLVMGGHITIIKIKVWETATSYAEWIKE